MSNRVLAVAAASIMGLYATTASAAPVLYVDISNTGNQVSTWVADLSSLGYATTVLSLGHGADITAPLSSYSVVIVSNGDAAYTNLSANTVANLSSYLDSGGALLYAGAHSLYSEPNAGTFAPQYLGVSSYDSNMPMFSSDSATAVGNGATYSMSPWSGGDYQNMLSAFATNTGTTSELALADGWTNTTPGATSIAALHSTATYNAATWGFDINHLTTTSDQLAFLGQTLNELSPQNVPEPGSLALVGAGTFGLGLLRRRKMG